MSQDLSVRVGVSTPAVPAVGPLNLFKAAWEHWKKIARAIGVVQTRLLMIALYFIFVFPLGLIMRLRGDPLHLRPRTGSNWMPHRHEPRSLETARRQF